MAVPYRSEWDRSGLGPFLVVFRFFLFFLCVLTDFSYGKHNPIPGSSTLFLFRSLLFLFLSVSYAFLTNICMQV